MHTHMAFTAWVCDESDSIRMACSAGRQRVGQAKPRQAKPRQAKPSQASVGNFSSALHMRRQRGGKRRTHPQAAQLNSTIKSKEKEKQKQSTAHNLSQVLMQFLHFSNTLELLVRKLYSARVSLVFAVWSLVFCWPISS